jgi:hypothetical protein
MADWGGAFSKMMTAGAGLIDREIQKEDKIEAEQRAADRQIATEERLMAIREAANARAEERKEALRQQGRLADFQFETNPENVKAKASAETTLLESTMPVKARLEREAESAKMNDPQYLAGLRKKAQATHIESASSIAAASLSKFQLGQLQEAASLQKEYRAAIDSGDAEAIAKAEKKIQAGRFTGEKKDSGDYLRAGTQLLARAKDVAMEDPEEAKALKELAMTSFKLGGLTPDEVNKKITGGGSSDNDPLGIRKKMQPQNSGTQSPAAAPAKTGLIDAPAPKTASQMAREQLDAAMQRTAQAIAAANNAGDMEEVSRLNELFAQQRQAKIKLG